MKKFLPSGNFRHPVWCILLALTFSSGIPQYVTGSTPPLSPELMMSVSNNTLTKNSDLVVSIDWYRNGIPYVTPPGAIQLYFYRIPDGMPVAAYMISRDEKKSLSMDDVRHFQRTIRSSELPGGEMMLIATDPLSGASYRLSIQVKEAGPDYPGFQGHQLNEAIFYGFTAVLIILLTGFFGSLIKKEE